MLLTTCVGSSCRLIRKHVQRLTKVALSTQHPKGCKCKSEKGDHQFATKAIHAGYRPSEWTTRPLIPPLVTSASFMYSNLDSPGGPFIYPRYGSPTKSVLEKTIAALEEGEYGLCFSSGLAALTAVVDMFGPGDHIICSEEIYGGCSHNLDKYARKIGLEVSFVDFLDVANLEKAMQSNTKLVWMESPTNPTLKMIDIQAVADIVARHRPAILAVDNTFMTPYFQKPLNHGADISMTSLSKYMNGHGDVVMGAVVTRRKDLYDLMYDIHCYHGAVPSSFDCYLVARGLKTLHIRMREHMNSALAVAKFLENHPRVERVIYPGLPSYPQKELAQRQCSGFSGMVSFYIKGGKEDVEKFVSGLRIITLCGSLGMTNSILCYPATISHGTLSVEKRLKLGITENFLRLSVGLEDKEDLIADLEEAFRTARTRSISHTENSYTEE